MKKFNWLLILFLFSAASLFSGVKIVVLGSSTAAGSGPVDKNNAWVARYSNYLRTVDASHKLVNLARGGYVTFQAMPTGYIPPSGVTFMPDTMYNITRALSLDPDAVIINFPSNDISNGISVDQQIENYRVMISHATEKDVPVWICTAQPVNYGTNQSARDKIKALKERIEAEFKDKSIDFYTGLCDATGKILSQYDSGDGLHLNDAAHAILFERALGAEILTSIGYNPDDSLSDMHSQPFLIDFGAVESPAPWNNITNTNSNSVGSFVENLKDITGKISDINIEVSKSFYGMNVLGPTVTFTTLNLPESASTDNFYTGGGYGELYITGLNANQNYDFAFFGSRTEFGGLSRETKFTVKGLNTYTGNLETINNYMNLLLLDGIKPATNKSVIIEITHGPANQNSSRYSHLSAMKIIPEITSNTTGLSKHKIKFLTQNGRNYASTSESGLLQVYSLSGLLQSSVSTPDFTQITELETSEKGLLIVRYLTETGIHSGKLLFY